MKINKVNRGHASVSLQRKQIANHLHFDTHDKSVVCMLDSYQHHHW
jgi:hypothetical protein